MLLRTLDKEKAEWNILDTYRSNSGRKVSGKERELRLAVKVFR